MLVKHRPIKGWLHIFDLLYHHVYKIQFKTMIAAVEITALIHQTQNFNNNKSFANNRPKTMEVQQSTDFEI